MNPRFALRARGRSQDSPGAQFCGARGPALSWDGCNDYFWVTAADFASYFGCSAGCASAGFSGSLARNYSFVTVAPVLPMVSTEAIVTLLTYCADLRLVSKERRLPGISLGSSLGRVPKAVRIEIVPAEGTGGVARR
jgi:hypothetical protein